MKRIFFLTVDFFVGMNLMAQTPISFYPHENAQDINVDTHLVIEFDKTVKAGSKGVITVTDKTTRKVVDRIDMSIPAGPVEGQPKNPHAIYTPVPYIYKVGHITNRNTRPGTPSGAAKEDKRKYQKTIIGGFSDAFHFYPVFCHGSKATIYLHNNMLDYGHEYEVKISNGVIEGWKGKTSWKFTTKKNAPSADLSQVVVAAMEAEISQPCKVPWIGYQTHCQQKLAGKRFSSRMEIMRNWCISATNDLLPSRESPWMEW